MNNQYTVNCTTNTIAERARRKKEQIENTLVCAIDRDNESQARKIQAYTERKAKRKSA